jgi:asparagine synthase (glutamine-hydrolysing)
MAVALEVRCPFLDHVLMEHAASLPPAWHFAGGITKSFLRAALRPRLLPAALARRKQGFSVPLQDWCRGPIGTAVEAVLGEPRLREWVAPDVVRSLLQRHRAGVGDHAELLWSVLVFARFLARWA